LKDKKPVTLREGGILYPVQSILLEKEKFEGKERRKLHLGEDRRGRERLYHDSKKKESILKFRENIAA